MTDLYAGLWNSCDGLTWAEIRASPPDGPYPAMVRLTLDAGNAEDCTISITVEDARDLAAHIDAAVAEADREMRKLGMRS